MNSQAIEEQKNIINQAIRAIDAFANLEFKDKPSLELNEIDEIVRELNNIIAVSSYQIEIKPQIIEELELLKKKINREHVQRIIKLKIEKEMIQKTITDLRLKLQSIDNNIFLKFIGANLEEKEDLRKKILSLNFSFKNLNNKYYALKQSDPSANEKDIIICKMNIQKLLIDRMVKK